MTYNLKPSKSRSVSREYLRIESTSRFVLIEALGRSRKRIQDGDVIFARVRPTLLRVAKVPTELDGQVCSTAFCVLGRDGKIDLHRKKRAVLDRLFKALLHKLMTGEIPVRDINLTVLTRTK